MKTEFSQLIPHSYPDIGVITFYYENGGHGVWPIIGWAQEFEDDLFTLKACIPSDFPALISVTDDPWGDADEYFMHNTVNDAVNIRGIWRPYSEARAEWRHQYENNL